MRTSLAAGLLRSCGFALLVAGCGSTSQPPAEQHATTAQALSLAPLDCAGPTADWPMFGQNVCNTRSTSSLGGITPATAKKLSLKWSYKAAGDISATPAVVGNELFVPDWGGMLNKVDARTGQPVWAVSIGALIGIDADAGAGPDDTPAPVLSRDTPVVTADSVILGVYPGGFANLPQSASILVAVDRFTGALRWQTTLDAHPASVISSSPVFDNGVVYVGVSSGEEGFAALPLYGVPYTCCSFRGSVVALDAHSGNILWKTYTIEDNAYLADGGLSGFAGAAVWSTPTIDRARRSLYVTTGNNYSEPAGTTTLPPGDHVESILSLDLDTGAIKWAQRMTSGDVWNFYDYFTEGPTGGGPDDDFGSGANLLQAWVHGVWRDVVGAGQKSGVYWAVDPDTGTVLWNTAVGPGGHLGGIHWGTASDAQRIYVGVNDTFGTSYVLGGSGPQSGQTATVGSWAALDPSTGAIEWQIADPALTTPLNQTSVNGPVSAVNGVLFGGSMDAQGTMFAIDGATGAVLWSFPSGATVYGGPAIANDTVYWGNGYPASHLQFGTPGGTLFAFHVAE